MDAHASELAREAGRRLHRFYGGLRLHHHKQVSCREPIGRLPMPERLYVPLLQHSGDVAACVVKQGQAVLGGELIGRAGASGANVHAPTSGVVERLVELPIAHPSGQPGACVVLRTDGLDRQAPAAIPDDWRAADPAQLRDAIAEAGIVGLGGAVFPTGSKSESATSRGVHTLILNGAECEPYIACDEMLMRERPERIVRGAQILQRATGAERTVIAIEGQMGAVRSALEDAVRDAGADSLAVVRVQTIYPEGGERQLIQVLTGLEVPDGGYRYDREGVLAALRSGEAS